MRLVLLTVAAAVAVPRLANGQQTPDETAGMIVGNKAFIMIPGLPTCAPGAVQSGDPTKGPSIILAKVAAGCSIPWHWHTPNEHLMIVSGEVRLEEKDGKPFVLHAGGFARLPGRHVHQFRCTSACTLFVYSDAALDIHYVDREGQELSPDAALMLVKEKAAAPPQ